MRVVKCIVSSVFFALLLSSLSHAASPDRISGKIDSANMVELKNHVAVMAQSQFDKGPVDGSLALQVTMLFMPSAQQQAALKQLLADQQNPKSPKFHQWLTSDQFGQQFGLSQNDIAKVRSWLESEGLKVTYVSHGHDFLSFEGSAAQVQGVFRTSIHNYSVKGKTHFANVSAPMIPAALSGIVGGFRGLHNFFPHPMLKQRPNYTITTNQGSFTLLAPGDIATIYHLGPLYSQTPAIDGTGQKVVIAGQSDVYLADLNYFRSNFGFTSISGCTMDATNTIINAGTCSTGNFQVVWPHDSAHDPGVNPGDVGESDLDIEWMNSVAPGANIIFVTSANGVDDSASWAIDQNPPLAPVISYSYGLCEAFVTAPSIAAAETEYQKAATEGISFFAASGDAAAATCDGDDGFYPATLGPSVSYPASSPNVTGVGGTEFDEGTGTFWTASNGANGNSAISYIPETAWNDSALSFVDTLDGSGGGASNCAFGTGMTQVSGPAGGPFAFELCKAPTNGGFPKPSWQTGVAGVPSDSVRDVPDISFSASNVNDPYIVCVPQSETNGSTSTSTCVSGISTAILTYNSAFGGTSAATPVTAGMTVLMNQFLGGNGLGLINPQLYKLFTANPTGVFNDTKSGTNSITGGTSDNVLACAKGTPSFEPTALQCPQNSPFTFGFTVGGGHTYNQVTGLGSVDINAFVNAWATSRPATTTTISPSSSSVGQGASVTFTSTVTPSTATGTVSFFDNGSSTALGSGTLSGGTATFTTTALTSGNNSVVATYSGDGYDNVSSSTPAVVAVTGFSLNSPSATVTAGHTTSAITVTLTPINGFNSQVTFSCVNLPAGIAPSGGCTFTPLTVTPDGVHPISTSLTIATAPSMATGTTSVTVSAVGGGATITSTVSLTVNPTDQSFQLALQGGGSLQVAQGAQVIATVNLTGSGGFNANVSYTCSDPASESTCTGPQGYVSSSTAAAFTITTTAPVAQLRKPSGRGTGIFYAVLLPGVLGILFTLGSRRRSSSLRGMRLLGLIVVLGVSTLWMGACSGSNSSSNKNPGTPTGNYNFVITATTGGANPVTNQLTVMVTVVP